MILAEDRQELAPYDDDQARDEFMAGYADLEEPEIVAVWEGVASIITVALGVLVATSIVLAIACSIAWNVGYAAGLAAGGG